MKYNKSYEPKTIKMNPEEGYLAKKEKLTNYKISCKTKYLDYNAITYSVRVNFYKSIVEYDHVCPVRNSMIGTNTKYGD